MARKKELVLNLRPYPWSGNSGSSHSEDCQTDNRYHSRCGGHRDQPRHFPALWLGKFLRRNCFEPLEQLLPTLFAQLKRGRLHGSLLSGLSRHLAHELNRELQLLIYLGQLNFKPMSNSSTIPKSPHLTVSNLGKWL